MSRPRQSFGQQPGRLVATMLRVLAAELADPGRYARAKAYARDGAVIDIDIRERVVAGLVLGSRPDPYEVYLVVDAAPAHELETGDSQPATMTLLVPGRDEMAVSCTCPDAAGALCKHAVAVLLAVADEASIEPGLLVRWRSPGDQSAGTGQPAAVRLARRGGSGITGPAAAGSGRPAAPPVVKVDVLAGMLDATAALPPLPEIAPLRLPAPPPVVLTDPAARLLHQLTTDALSVIAPRRGSAS